MKGTPHSDKHKKDRTRNNKGILLEELVAMLHDYEGVKVEKNVKLSPKSGDKSRKIEIDVLLTSYVAGYPIRIAIQCKNYEKRITREQIGAFKDSLDDAGMPYQHGIVVSVHGYQSGAIKRAKELGIRTRELKGLTKDRLAAEIQEAFQFFIYLLPVVTELSVINEIQKDKFGGVLSMAFFDKNQIFRGLALDLVVSQWRQDNISSLLGEYNLKLKVPSGWYQLSKNKPAKVFSIEATVKIVAYLIKLVGKAKTFSLVDAETKRTEKIHIEADFKNSTQTNYEIITQYFVSEQELQEFFDSNDKFKIIQRIKLPRILFDAFYHPFSKRAMDFLKKRTEGLTLNQIKKLPRISFEDLEGKVENSVYDETWQGFPVLVEDNNGELLDLRLLFEERNYQKIISIRHTFEKHPMPEFAELLKQTNKEIGRLILGFK